MFPLFTANPQCALQAILPPPRCKKNYKAHKPDIIAPTADELGCFLHYLLNNQASLFPLFQKPLFWLPNQIFDCQSPPCRNGRAAEKFPGCQWFSKPGLECNNQATWRDHCLNSGTRCQPLN